MKIMVIDDSTTMRLIISRTLKELGHEVVQAANGKEGLEASRAADGLSAVFVDWNMPEMNGFEFVVAARADAKLKTVPIVMVTTENEAPNVQKALDAGADQFILKPFTRDSIQEKLALLRPA
ncbi:MAG: response regulator [Elusimicrobia bacterium]|nr:response regulator [Elusimicrobiota bacterium]